MEIHKIGGNIGAEILGVDPRAMDDATFEVVSAALLGHEVIFFRGADLSDEDHLALGARLGELSIFPMAGLFQPDSGPTITAIQDGPDSPPAADGWHTDVTWTREPPKFALLRGVQIPEAGGDTLWGSMTTAYEALSPKLREMIDGLEVRHHCEGFVAAVAGKMSDEILKAMRFRERMYEAFPAVDHPLVRTHPETGKRALMWGGYFMQQVVGMHADESRALLELLERHIESPNFHCRWRWQVGDLAIWDERSTVHRALSDHFPAHREVRRCTVEGDRPFFRAA